MTGCEVWLCRVLLHQGHAGAKLAGLDEQAVLAKVIAGELGCLPDGAIVEPVQSFRTEPEAAAERERRMRDAPGEDWRVVITMAVGR